MSAPVGDQTWRSLAAIEVVKTSSAINRSAFDRKGPGKLQPACPALSPPLGFQVVLLFPDNCPPPPNATPCAPLCHPCARLHARKRTECTAPKGAIQPEVRHLPWISQTEAGGFDSHGRTPLIIASASERSPLCSPQTPVAATRRQLGHKHGTTRRP